MNLYLDIGGTHLRYQKEKDSQLIDSGDVPTAGRDLITAIETLLPSDEKTDFIGISFAGQVKNGKILSAPNITVSATDIQNYFHQQHGIHLEIENDLKCAALAESNHWNPQGLLVALFPGTGLGSAYIQDGKLIRGVNNLAGEIGHVPFRASPLTCGCGKNDCLELYASGSGLAKWIKHYDLPLETPSLKQLKELNTPEAQEILNHFENALLQACATLITILNPSHLVLGGGIIQNNPDLVDMVQSRISSRVSSFALNDLHIVMSSLNNAAMEGTRLLR